MGRGRGVDGADTSASMAVREYIRPQDNQRWLRIASRRMRVTPTKLVGDGQQCIPGLRRIEDKADDKHPIGLHLTKDRARTRLE
jgi:hypothetical protein